ELTMAHFELANCHRHGWGMEIDPKTAFKYYQVAANMGDNEARAETAWCLEHGFGTKKDKVCSFLICLVPHIFECLSRLRLQWSLTGTCLASSRILLPRTAWLYRMARFID